MTVTWADPERRMLKRKLAQEGGGCAPSGYVQPAVPPGEEREVRLQTFHMIKYQIYCSNL